MAKQLHPSSLAYWTEGKLRKKIQLYSKDATFYQVFTATEISSSGDFLSLGAISASNNLAIGGNMHLSGTITLGEVSSAPSPGTDEGILYVKSDGKLYFKGQSNSSTEIDLTAGAGTITALNNQAANRLVTIGSTTTELDGEANLTFDGSALTVAGNVSSSGDYYALGSVSASNNLAIGGNAEFSGSLNAASLSSSGDVYVLGSVSASNNVTIGGNLYVSGTILGITASNAVTALNNKAENRLVSIGSTTTELDGEANLTFNGSVLTVAGNVSSSGDYYALGSVSASNNLAVGGNAEITGSVNASGDIITEGTVSASNFFLTSSGTTVVQMGMTGDDDIMKWEWHRNGTRKWLYFLDGRDDQAHPQDSMVFKHGLVTDGNDHINFHMEQDDQTVYFHGDISVAASISGSNNLAVGGNAEITGSVFVSSSIQSAGFVSANGFGNSQVILTPTIIPAEYNCLLYGPVTIRDEGTLQIGADSVVIVRTFLDFTGSLG